jgi:hypothetical protein
MNTIPTIAEMRKAGHKVRVIHYRNAFRHNTYDGVKINKLFIYSKNNRNIPADFYLDQCGGATTIDITTNSGADIKTSSRCHLNDNYNRKTGIMKAIAKIRNKLTV